MSPDDEHDPIAFLRPSRPAPTGGRFNVLVTDAGDNRPVVVAALCEATGMYENEARQLLQSLPALICVSAPALRAQEVGERLRAAGAAVITEQNDG